MQIYPLIRPNSGPDFHRLLLPLETMGLDLKPAFSVPIGEALQTCKIVIYNRTTSFDFNHLLKYRWKYGFKILLDLDDWWFLYPQHISYSSWKRHGVSQKIRESILNADYIMCTTNRLAGEISKLNAKVEVVPNALPFDEGQFTSEKEEPSDKFRVLYAGGTTHQRDLASIRGVFDKLKAHKKELEISLAGYNDSNPETKQIWESYKNIMKCDKVYRTLPLEKYMEHYMYADLSIAPLEANPFNSFKSNLKVLEAGCKNIPIITSNCPPYSDEESDVVWMAGSVKEWYTLLHKCIKNPTLAQEQGQKLGEYVRDRYNLHKVNEIRKQIFNYLLT